MRLIKIIVSSIFLIILSCKCVQAEELQNVIEEQKDLVQISNLIDDANEYTSDVFDKNDLYEVLEDAINGKIDSNRITKSSLSILGKELKSSVAMIGSIITIIIVNGILISITEGLENKSVCKIAEYVQIILIVTVDFITSSA